VSGSTKLATFLSIIGTLALGPLIWFIAVVLAPALLPTPQPQQMQLIPVYPAPSPPTELQASVRTADARLPYRSTPEPIPDRWRFRADGTLEMLLESRSSTYSSHPPPRSQP
jgi:hypothetical protein